MDVILVVVLLFGSMLESAKPCKVVASGREKDWLVKVIPTIKQNFLCSGRIKRHLLSNHKRESSKWLVCIGSGNL